MGHPADGIYATSKARLMEEGACSNGIEDFCFSARVLGYSVTDNTQVPITLSLLCSIMERHPFMGWVINKMFERRLITRREKLDAGLACFNQDLLTVSSRREGALIIMDLLLTRAKREGRIS